MGLVGTCRERSNVLITTRIHSSSLNTHVCVFTWSVSWRWSLGHVQMLYSSSSVLTGRQCQKEGPVMLTLHDVILFICLSLCLCIGLCDCVCLCVWALTFCSSLAPEYLADMAAISLPNEIAHCCTLKKREIWISLLFSFTPISFVIVRVRGVRAPKCRHKQRCPPPWHGLINGKEFKTENAPLMEEMNAESLTTWEFH